MNFNEKINEFDSKKQNIYAQIESLQQQLEKVKLDKNEYIRGVIRNSIFDKNALFTVLVDLYNVYEAPEMFIFSDYKTPHSVGRVIIDSKGHCHLIAKCENSSDIDCSSSEMITLESNEGVVVLGGINSKFVTTFHNTPIFVLDFIDFIVSSRMVKPFASDDLSKLKELERSFLVERRDEIEKHFSEVEASELRAANERAKKRNLILQELDSNKKGTQS